MATREKMPGHAVVEGGVAHVVRAAKYEPRKSPPWWTVIVERWVYHHYSAQTAWGERWKWKMQRTWTLNTGKVLCHGPGWTEYESKRYHTQADADAAVAAERARLARARDERQARRKAAVA